MAKKKKTTPVIEKIPASQGLTPSSITSPLERFKDWQIGLALVVLMAIVMLIFFRSFVFDPNAMLYGTDVQSQAYQSRLFAKNFFLANHQLPLWNPFIYSGLPFIEILPYDVYYPFALTYLIMPLHRAIGWRWLVHIPLAALFMFMFLRAIGRSRESSFFGGVAYSMTGTILSYLFGGHDGRAFVVVWTPLAFYFARRAIDTRRLYHFAGLAIAIALQVVTPHVQMMYFSCLALMTYIIYSLVVKYKAKEIDRKVLIRLLSLFLIAGILASSIGMAQLLPTTTFLRFSDRGAEGETGYAFASSWAMPPQEVFSLIVPDYIGLVFNYWGTNLFRLHSEYAGILILFLALLAIFVRRDSEGIFWSILAFIGILFCMGAATPVHKIAYYLIPMMGKFRGPSMMMFIVALAFIVLATKTIDDLLQKPYEGIKKNFIYVAGAFLGVFILVWFISEVSPDSMKSFWQNTLYGDKLTEANRSKMGANYSNYLSGIRYCGFILLLGSALLYFAYIKRLKSRLDKRLYLFTISGLVLLTLIDLYRVDSNFLLAPNPEKTDYNAKIVHPKEYYKPDDGLRFISEDNGFYRILPLPDPFRGIYGPNDLMLYSMRTVSGSQNFRLLWYKELVSLQRDFLRCVLVGDIPAIINPNIWKILGVKYITTRQPINEPFGLTRQELEANTMKITSHTLLGKPDGLRLVYANQRDMIFIYEFTHALPQYFFPKKALIASRDDALQAMLKKDFSPSRDIYLEESPPEGLDYGEAKVISSKETPNGFKVDVEAANLSFMVQSEIWHPYWRAYIDNKQVPIYRADAMLRGIVIPKGRHTIELKYISNTVKIGQIVSIIGLLLTLIIGISSIIIDNRKG